MAEATSTEKANFDAILARQDAAYALITALNRPRNTEGSREWVISIPVRKNWDPDVVICESLRDINGLLGELKANREKVAELRVLLRKARSDIWQTARVNQGNINGVDPLTPEDAPCKAWIGNHLVTQGGVNESLKVVAEIDALEVVSVEGISALVMKGNQ